MTPTGAPEMWRRLASFALPTLFVDRCPEMARIKYLHIIDVLVYKEAALTGHGDNGGNWRRTTASGHITLLNLSCHLSFLTLSLLIRVAASVRIRMIATRLI